MREKLLEILRERRANYSPGKNRRNIQFEMTDAVMAALRPFMPDLPPGSECCTAMMVQKFTRAVEGAWHGRWHEDNFDDLGGYAACQAALSSGKTPEQVLEEFV